MVRGGNAMSDYAKEFANKFDDSKFRKDIREPTHNENGGIILENLKGYSKNNTPEKNIELMLNPIGRLKYENLEDYDAKKYNELKTAKDKDNYLEGLEEKGRYKTETKRLKANPIRGKTVLVLFLLAALYIILTWFVISIYTKAGNKVTKEKLHQNSYTFVVSSMTIAITVVATLLLGFLADDKRLALFLFIFSLFGLTTSGIGIQWLKESDKLSKKYIKNGNIALGVSIFFSGGFMLLSFVLMLAASY
jgi:hypothetical protein